MKTKATLNSEGDRKQSELSKCSSGEGGANLVCGLVQDGKASLQTVEATQSEAVGEFNCTGHNKINECLWVKTASSHQQISVCDVSAGGTQQHLVLRTLRFQTLEEGRGSSHGLFGNVANSNLCHPSHQAQQRVPVFDPRVRRSHRL